jgi:hypothetical protein
VVLLLLLVMLLAGTGCRLVLIQEAVVEVPSSLHVSPIKSNYK